MDDHLDRADRLVVAAMRLTRTLQALAGRGPLTSPQVGALIVVVYAGRIVAKELAALQQVTPATMSRLVAELEARALVTRSPDEKDARLQWIEPTREGRALVKTEHRRRLKSLAQAMGKLSSDERQRLGEAAALIERLTQDLAS